MLSIAQALFVSFTNDISTPAICFRPTKGGEEENVKLFRWMTSCARRICSLSNRQCLFWKDGYLSHSGGTMAGM